MMMLVVAILAVLTLAGLLLLMSGLRGRQVNDHPICTRCGFDLIGIVRDGQASTEQCPECGARLVVPGAVRKGQRRRRPSHIVAGVLLILTGLCGVGGLVAGSIAKVPWNTYKPGWLLEQEAVLSPGADAGVLNELMARRAMDTVDARMYRRLAEHAIGRHTKLSMGWDPSWDALIEDAMKRGELSEELYTQYRIDGLSASLTLGDRVHAGQSVPYELMIVSTRPDARKGLWLSVEGSTIKVEGDHGREYVAENPGCGLMNGWSGGRASLGSQLKIRGVPPGKRRVTVTVDIDINQPNSLIVAATKRVEASKIIEFLDDGSELVTTTPNPMLIPAIRKSIRSIQIVNDRADDGMLTLRAEFENAPVDLSFAVTAVRRGADGVPEEWALPSIAVRKGGGVDTNYGEAQRSLDEGPVDLVLRTSTHRAMQHGGITDVWDGELTISGVVVTGSP